MRAGIYPGAISAIMNGQRPGLEVCKGLARSFGVSAEYLLRLAGHLPPEAPVTVMDIPLIQQFLYKLRKLPPARQEHYMRMALMLFDLGDDHEGEVLSDAPSIESRDDRSSAATD